MNLTRKVLYLGFAIPKKSQEEVARIDKSPHFATHNFSWSLVRALRSGFGTVSIISTLEIRNWPSVRKIFFPSKNFLEHDVSGTQIGFVNVILLKHVSRIFQLICRAKSVVSGKKNSLFVLHGTHTPFMLFAMLAKYIWRCRIVIVLTDQHGNDVAGDGISGRVLRKVDTMLMKYFLHKFDGYICLSPSFVSRYNLHPVLVLPGILNKDFANLVLEKPNFVKTSETFDLVYAGGVNRGNGIDLLLSAFSKLQNNKVRLSIYGGGDLVKAVIDASRKDMRISYRGIVHVTELVQSLVYADLLVYCRPVDVEYLQYSFPSKLIEYMATGVPTLTSRIASIPKEIEDCFFYIDGNGPDSIANAIIGVMTLTAEERFAVGRRAAETATRLYCEEVAGQKICDLARFY